MKNWNLIQKKDKLEIFTKIATNKGTTTCAVEKDWWINETINLIFQTRLSSHLILKGGSTFNKTWNLIANYSTDIDLFLDVSYYGSKKKVTSSELQTIKNRLSNYVNEQFSPFLEQKFKEKELNTLIKLKENNPHENALFIEIEYTSILNKKIKNKKSQISLKIDYDFDSEPNKLKIFSSLIENQYQGTALASRPFKIPCISPEHVL